ncbi:MAG: transposase [Methanobacteriota archaeon]|nr:MAG: transposase [Euryarchaeota archaeon]
MWLIVISKNDTASLNISRNLLDLADWDTKGEFQGNPILVHENFTMATIDDEHLEHDNVDLEFFESTGIRPEIVIFASRHRSESGLRSLTVHTPGNFSTAELGGKPEALVPSCPLQFTCALRMLKDTSQKLDYKVSFEATHHGPYLETPAFYIEIGSDESCWVEEAAGRAIAEAILAIKHEEEPVAVGVGGGHYAPRITDVALQSKLSYGHINPSYALDRNKEKMLEEAIEKTPGAEYVYFHRKAMKKSQYRELGAWFEARGLQSVSQKSLESRE